LHQQDLKASEIKELKLKIEELNEKVNLIHEQSQINNRYQSDVNHDTDTWSSVTGISNGTGKTTSTQPLQLQNKQVINQIMQIQFQHQKIQSNNNGTHHRSGSKPTNNIQYDNSSDNSNDSNETSDNSIEMGNV
jgi:hypothetical protein